MALSCSFRFLSIVVFRSSREEHIATAIQGGLDRVLHHTDDEAYGNSLHGHIVADAEERTSHWDEQQ